MSPVRVALANLEYPPSAADSVTLATQAIAALERAWSQVAGAAARANVAIILGTERIAEAGSYRPTAFGEPGNTFHERAVRCRAADNTCFLASVNGASEGSEATTAIARPDGTLLADTPYGQRGLLIADLDLAAATGLLATRFREPRGED